MSTESFDDHTSDHQDRQADHTTHPQTEHSAGAQTGAYSGLGVGALSLQLLGDSRLSGRGNAPVRIAMLQRMQQSLGNRQTVQRLRAASSQPAAPAPVPVQRDWLTGGGVGAVVGGVLGGPAGAVVGGLIGAGLGALFDSGGTSKSYGTWKLAQTLNSAPAPGGSYSSPVEITFSPNVKTVDSTEIAFVQNVRFVDTGTANSRDTRANFTNRRTKTGWTIDRVPDRKSGYYGYNNDGKPSGTITPGSAPTPLKDASLRDTPSWNQPNTTWEFETAAIAKAGKDVGMNYGTLTWGFTVDKDNKLTAQKEKSNVHASADFNDAVKAWNTQAKGAEGDRNHKDQEELGPFK